MTKASAIRRCRRSKDGPLVEPTTGKGPAFYRRVIAVLRKEPELDTDQIAERFGLTEHQVWDMRAAARLAK